MFWYFNTRKRTALRYFCAMKNTQINAKLLIFIVSMAITSVLKAQNATSLTISGGSGTNTISNNTATAVDNTITVNANGNITDFTVSITDSYTAGDVLSYSGTLPSGISVGSPAFNTTSRSITFYGTTTAANWQTLLRTVTLTTTSAVCNPESRKITFTAGNNYYNAFNGHYYRYYATTGSWTNAKSYAETQSLFGMQGYLATITTKAENSFIAKIVGNNSWIGCTDRYDYINTAVGYTKYAANNPYGYSNGGVYDGRYNGNAEGYWHWVTGPEKGTQIRTGNAVNVGGTTYHIGSVSSGQFDGWQANEPNDTKGGGSGAYGDEDYGHIYSYDGTWNDFYNSQSIGAVIEFGGMSTDNPGSSVLTFTKNIYINGAPSGSVSGGNVTVCSGTNSTTLSLTGMPSGSSVSYWESSLDNFLTPGSTISSTNSSITVSNVSTTTYYRAVVNTVSPSCSNLVTSSTPIYVNTTTAGNIVAENNTICPNGIVRFTLNGNNAPVSKWQVSTSSTFASGITDISNTSTSLTYTTSGTSNLYFRAVVANSTCGTSANSNIYTITISSGTNPVGGSINIGEHCGGTSVSGTLTLSGHTGSISRWEYSTDGGIIWNTVPSSTAATLSYSGVTSNRLYRALLTSGTCGSAYSSYGEVIIYGSTVWKWLGTTNSSWSTASNWCPSSVPGSGKDIIISSTATNSPTLSTNVTIGDLDFNGTGIDLHLNGNTLTFGSITNASSSSFIVTTNGTGLMKSTLSNSDSMIFPIGISTTSYTPVVIVNKTGASDNISVGISNEVLTRGTTGSIVSLDHVKRTWQIESSNGNSNAGSGLNVYLNWNSGDLTGTLVNPKLNRFNTSTNNWEIVSTGTSSSVSSTQVKHIGIKSNLGLFAIGNGNVPLPIQIMNFEASKNGSVVNLGWLVSASDKISNFEVLKSYDGRNWERLTTINSQANSTITSYQYTDATPGISNVYYRIKQIDLDGKSYLSQIKEVNFEKVAELSVYPNPSNDGAVNVVLEGIFTYNVSDMFGRQVVSGSAHNSTVLNKLDKGIYYLLIESNERTERVKIIVN